MSNREDFDPDRPVRLAQDCFTGNGDEVLMVGQTYSLENIPDIAFELGIVQQDPLPESAEPAAAEPPTNQTRKQRTAQSQQSQPPEGA